MIIKIFSLYMFFGVMLLSVTFAYSFYRGKSAFTKVLGILCLTLLIYLMGYLLEVNSKSMDDILFWNQVQYFGIPFFPALWLLMSMLYTGRVKKIREGLVLVFIIPILTFLLRLTNEYHHLYYRQMELKEFESVSLLLLTKGPWYYVQMIYTLVCLILCTGYYYQSFAKKRKKEGQIQFRLFLLASLLPYVALVLININLVNIGIDYTALILPICILLINISLAKYDFLEIKLMARERVFEDSHDGLVILNRDLEIMDYNSASREFFSWLNVTIRPGKLDALLENCSDVVEFVRQQKEATLKLTVDEKEKYISITPKEICNKKEKVGTLLSIMDVTERELTNRKLLEMAIFDELSGLYNRRYFGEQAQVAINRAICYGEDLSLIIMDVDNFKEINDKYGHICGDGVVRSVSEQLKSSLRKTDILGRIGGDEFCIVMTNAKSENAYAKAEAVREIIENMDYEYEGQKIPVRVSMGIAELEKNFQSLIELVRFADDALYRSKENGEKSDYSV